jgi:hypothetical protein
MKRERNDTMGEKEEFYHCRERAFMVEGEIKRGRVRATRRRKIKIKIKMIFFLINCIILKNKFQP